MKNSNKYNHIDSFKALETEKMRMYYEVKLSKRKIDLRLMEMEMMLNPMRLMPFVFNEMLSPLVGNLKDWFLGLFQRNKGKNDAKETID